MTATSPLTVLVTGCGAPGTVGTLWSLEENPHDRRVRTVGVDVRSRQAGRHLCDAFHTVPPADDEAFVERLLRVCESEGVDAVLPQVTRELSVLAANVERFREIGVGVAVSSASAIQEANDKAAVVDACEALGVPAPQTERVETWAELTAACEAFGYPETPVVIKPPVSNGSRGLRILDASRDRKRAFYDEKPDGAHTTLDALKPILGESFPPLLVTEYLPGTEYTVDVFRDGRETTVLPRSRDAVRSGISFQGTTVEHDAIIDASEALASRLDLEYAFGFQFKEATDGTPKILECNPRIQGTMVTSTLAEANFVYAAAAVAAGEPVPSFDPVWGTEFDRYWGGIGVFDGELVGNIGQL